MKTQSIPRQLLLLLSLAIGVAALASAALYGTLQQSLRNSSKLTQSALTHLDENYDLLSKLATLQSTVQSLVRQKDPDAIEAGIKQVESAQQNVLTVIRARGEDAKAVVAAYERLGEQRQLVLNQILTGNGNAAYELFLSAHNPQFEAVLQAAHALQEAVQQQTRAELTTREREIQSGVRWRMAGVAVVLLIVFALGWRMKRRIASSLERVVTDLSAVTDSLSSNANQISTASQSLAEGSSSQAASIEETSASLEEMASMTKRNAENAHKANELARQTRSAAEGGAANMDQMSAAMGAIKGSSDDIAKIIKTIDEIAFQTNILALNAAVEAARAGEAGMGFAVVADEVRALAQRSAKAAKETAEKIEGAISKTAQGVDISGKVAHALNDIVIKVRQVDELAAEVAGASREQTQGITQINTAVGQMDKVTQNNAAAAEESAAAAEELNGQAHVMKEAVAGLQQLCGLIATGKTVLLQSPERMESPIVSPARNAQKKPTNGHHNGNGAANPENRELVQPATSAAANRRSGIPMDGDFREF